MPRRGEANPQQPPLELSRKVKGLTILLPLGTSEGLYNVRIATVSGEERTEAGGTAVLSGGITSLHIALDLASLRRGPYLLQIRAPKIEWQSYLVQLR